MNNPISILALPAIRSNGGDMANLKRLASGVYRRSDGMLVVLATVWGNPGKRERVLPAGTKLHEAIMLREVLLEDLRGEPEPTRSSLTLNVYVEHYCNQAGDHVKTSIVSDIKRELGHLTIPEVEEAWTSFIDRQEHRYRKVWRLVDGKLKLVDTNKLISKSTIKGYKRYFKAICRFAMSRAVPKEIRLSKDDDPSSGIKIGKAEIRRRPLTPRERQVILEISAKLYPWFIPILQFAMTMPIRPNDQCVLKWSDIDALHGQIPYLPIKTRKTGTFAYPLILPHLQDFIKGRIGDGECPYIFYSVDKEGHRVQLTYNRLSSAWWTICQKGGIQDLRFYDLRHDAVNYCLSLGFTPRDVMVFAGWNSAEMVDGYDTRDRIRLAERAKGILASSMLDKYTVNESVNARGENGGKYGT
jgi:integrase